jgi:hypothetical protein
MPCFHSGIAAAALSVSPQNFFENIPWSAFKAFAGSKDESAKLTDGEFLAKCAISLSPKS